MSFNMETHEVDPCFQTSPGVARRNCVRCDAGVCPVRASTDPACRFGRLCRWPGIALLWSRRLWGSLRLLYHACHAGKQSLRKGSGYAALRRSRVLRARDGLRQLLVVTWLTPSYSYCPSILMAGNRHFVRYSRSLDGICLFEGHQFTCFAQKYRSLFQM